MAPALLIVGASIFGLLGIAHGWYTFRDSQNPRRLVPDSRAVLEAMKATDVRLSRGGTTMWKAWLGFNYSHTLGVLMFAIGCVAFALSLHALAPPKGTLLIPVAVGATYFWLAVRYWFLGAGPGHCYRYAVPFGCVAYLLTPRCSGLGT